jgi:NAD(P)-dependent dehydrogenase (short-subunit alcohol dehydrogenase family)
MLFNPFSLSGKNIIITGASSGIGRQCAVTCSRMGANVIIFGRDRVRLEETLKQMEEPDKHIICSIDLTEYDKIAAAVSGIIEKTGRINSLINCAGISTTLPLNSITHQKMEQFFQVNVICGINLTRHVVKSSNFSETGGSIIFISSVMGVAGEIGKSLYSMTKGALISAVKSLSVELAPRKIRVNAVSPGVVETPMSQNAVYSRNEESLNRIKALHPLGLGRPEDVANACVFLLSDASNWVTGTNLTVDGGYLAR